MKKVPLTVEGEAALRKELDQLKKVERPRVVEAIAEARAHGDLKENAEYHAAREEQGLMEARIRDLESKLSNAQVIDIAAMAQGDKVIFASTVTIINIDNDETFVYQIVGDDEADIKQQKISYQSPMARALIGKEVGDVVVVKTPSGEVEYEIDEVEYV
ncbi:MAG TPA: transcription elongation factor GreA [Porticoccaceae bacterium]|nr:transcription elongation factor GreA [Porticoccaceae bacterium]HCO60462.1 transcription elongation factor GreA [Porticoccaceae bacterium]